ncbi:MAG: hypothetical protein ACRD1V_06915 [Vicinamibacterales bacterium]
MSQRDEALNYIRSIGKEHSLTRDEVLAAFDGGEAGPPEGAPVALPAVSAGAISPHRLNTAEILAYIGGAVVSLGVAILIEQHWSVLSFETKLLVTLGLGIAMFVAGVLLQSREPLGGIGAAFHLAGALVMPIGLYVVFDHAGWSLDSPRLPTLISFILLVTYAASALIFRKTVLDLFTILFGTALALIAAGWLIDEHPLLSAWNFGEYCYLAVGAAYLFLGHYNSSGRSRSLAGFLYGFGAICSLGAALSLGGWKPTQNVAFELIGPLLAFGVLYLGVCVRRTSLLTFGTLFLMAYILKITAEYFSDSFGWPIALMIAGLAMVGVGYLWLSVKRRYLTAK